MLGRNNFDGNESTSDVSELKEIGDVAFYVSTFLIGLIGIFCILGNGLVLYISRKNHDFGGFQEVNSVVKHLAASDLLFGLIGCPLTIVWWYWGQIGDPPQMGIFAMKNEEWKMAVLRGFYFVYQCASAYFVFLIVLLRLKVVRDPLGNDTKRITKIACIVIWCLVVFINFLPIAGGIPLAFQEIPCNPGNGTAEQKIECMGKIGATKLPITICWLTVLHAGITVPLALTIITNILLIISVRKMKQKCDTKAKKKNWARLERLTNGIVISLIICNVPYIAWYHWSLALYMKTGMGWDGVEGIVFTAIARLLVTINSSLNPMVYATTIPNFKNTLMKIRRHEYVKDETLHSSSSIATKLFKSPNSSSPISTEQRDS